MQVDAAVYVYVVMMCTPGAQIVEEDSAESARQRGVGRSASVASLAEKKDGSVVSPTAPAVTVLLPLLKVGLHDRPTSVAHLLASAVDLYSLGCTGRDF